MNAQRAGILPRECWAIKLQLGRRRPELDQLRLQAIAIHEDLDAARRPRGPEFRGVEAWLLLDSQHMK